MNGTPEEHLAQLKALNHEIEMYSQSYGDGTQVVYKCIHCRQEGRVYIPRNLTRAYMYGRLTLDLQCPRAQHDFLTAFLNLWRRL